MIVLLACDSVKVGDRPFMCRGWEHSARCAQLVQRASIEGHPAPTLDVVCGAGGISHGFVFNTVCVVVGWWHKPWFCYKLNINI